MGFNLPTPFRPPCLANLGPKKPAFETSSAKLQLQEGKTTKQKTLTVVSAVVLFSSFLLFGLISAALNISHTLYVILFTVLMGVWLAVALIVVRIEKAKRERAKQAAQEAKKRADSWRELRGKLPDIWAKMPLMTSVPDKHPRKRKPDPGHGKRR
jgi:hypothetical protein